MNEEFIFRVGADVSQFTKSISDVEKELKKVQTELKTKTGAAIVETNKYINDLQGSLDNLRKEGLNKLPQAVGAGASSLNALGQVARDAPFGFIAIQNNLPILFDQLGTLSTKSGGAVGALKSLGASLIGPAGVTFAIGAAISAVTVLVQKYGSFGAALEAIFTKQSRLSEEILEANKNYEKFNKEKRSSIEISNQESASTEGQVAKIKALSSIVLDQTRSYNERNSALNELKSINKEYFGNLDLEKTKFEDLKVAIDTYISSVKQAAISKGFEQAISETSVELAKAIELESKLKKELALSRRTIKTKNRGQDIDTSDIDVAKEALDAQTKVVNALRKEINLYNTELEKSITLQNKIQAPIDAANKKFADQQKEIDDKKKKDAKLKALAQERIRDAERERNELLRITRERIDRQEFLNQEELKNLRTNVEERRKIERQIGINIPKVLPTAPPAIPINVDNINAQAKSASLALKQIKKDADLTSAYELANQTFFNPIAEVFDNFLNTGKFAFKEFGKAVIQAINQIVAKVIATGIISLLFNIFSGGFGVAKGGASGGFKAVLNAITSSLGFGKAAQIPTPNLANLNGGGMQMSGQVVFVQRGSDLVGVLNRTNGTINRVG